MVETNTALASEDSLNSAAEEHPIVRIRNLHKSFDDLHVLRGVDLDVYRG